MTADFHARILVVGDEPDAVRELAFQLRELDCRVLDVVTNEERALELATRLVPDLVLVELAAPSASVEPPIVSALRRRTGAPILQLVRRALPVRAALEHALARVRLELDYRALSRRSQIQERSSALGTLAAGLSRELERPLDFVLGNQQYALRELSALRPLLEGGAPAGQERALEFASEIESALRNALAGVERLRTAAAEFRRLSRPPARQASDLDVRAALDAALSLTQSDLSRRARVIRDFDACPRVHADEVSLIALFVHLLSNAAQAIEKGGRELNEVRVVTRTSPQGGAHVEVRDTGSGIPPADFPRIFEPFFTTREAGTNAGLGLSMAHVIVSSLGGSIEVDSHVGAGSTFRVLLPAAGEGTRDFASPPVVRRARVDPSRTPSAAASDTRERLLLVDDEPILLDALTRALEGPYAVARACGGGAALELLAAGNQYDLVMCDLMMPGMTGMDLFKAIEKEFPDTLRRMAFMTGGAFTAPAQQFIAAPGRRVLEKPFTNDELFAFVAGCLSRSRQGLL